MAVLDVQRAHSQHHTDISVLDLSCPLETCSPEQELGFDTATFDIDDLLRDSPSSESAGLSPKDVSFRAESEDFYRIPPKLWSSFIRERSCVEASPETNTQGTRTSSDSGTDTRMTGAESIEYKAAEPRKARRQAQNRAAQRAFRERKEKYIQELEGKVVAMGRKIVSLESDRKRLEGLVRVARTEVETLRSLPSQYTQRMTTQADRSQVACKIDGVAGRHTLLLTLDLGIEGVKLCSDNDKSFSDVALSTQEHKNAERTLG